MIVCVCVCSVFLSFFGVCCVPEDESGRKRCDRLHCIVVDAATLYDSCLPASQLGVRSSHWVLILLLMLHDVWCFMGEFGVAALAPVALSGLVSLAECVCACGAGRFKLPLLGVKSVCAFCCCGSGVCDWGAASFVPILCVCPTAAARGHCCYSLASTVYYL